MELNLAPGIEGRTEIVVTDDKTAVAFCSGTLEVFATPSMIALMEQTAMESVAYLLPEGFTTVGFEVCVRHLKATFVGDVVTINSKLIESDNRKLVFEVAAKDRSGLIGKGTHTRYIVDKQIFIDNLKNK
jgi:predicted thioesterase